MIDEKTIAFYRKDSEYSLKDLIDEAYISGYHFEVSLYYHSKVKELQQREIVNPEKLALLSSFYRLLEYERLV